MMHFGNFGGMGFGGFGSIFMVLFWVIIIAIGIYFGKKLFEMNKKSPDSDSAEETLRRRYVRGEIGKEKYEEMLKDIKGLPH